MRLAVIIPSWDPERVIRTVRLMAENAVTDEVGYVAVVSGVDLAKFDPAVHWMHCRPRLGVLEAMAQGARFGIGNDADYLLFIHDDVDILEPAWDRYVLDTLSGLPRCGLAGFFGALGLGADDIYHAPYRLQQLVRLTPFSNMDNAEDHGHQTDEHMRVTALDGFSLLLTRAAYEAIGGWEAAIKDGMPDFHMYDAWVCCAVAEKGFETWLLPVKCHHWGGRTSTTADYQDFIASKGWESGHQLFERSHEVVYERFRNVLPLRLTA